MPLPPDPRGNSVDTPNLGARPNPQTQTPAPIPHPGQSVVAQHPPCDIPPSPLRALGALGGEISSPPHPPSQRLSESAARELELLKSQLHALASPDGFAPSRDEFARAVRQATPPYRKFFRGYDDFIRSCGYRSATDRRRELAAVQRAAQWQAQSAVQSTRHPIFNSTFDSTVNSTFNSAPNSDPTHESPTSSVPSLSSAPSAPSAPSVPSTPPSGTPAPAHFPGMAPSKPPISPRPRTNELFYGDPIHCCDMAHAPVNEQGVVLLFGILAKKLGFRIEMVRTGYPDCEAKHKGKDGKWRRLRIEFEFLSSRFNHDPSGCDLIVCWEDDFNPTNLEVLELKNHVAREAPSPREGVGGRESFTQQPPTADTQSSLHSEAPSPREGVGGRESFTQQPPTADMQTSLHSEAPSPREGVGGRVSDLPAAESQIPKLKTDFIEHPAPQAHPQTPAPSGHDKDDERYTVRFQAQGRQPGLEESTVHGESHAATAAIEVAKLQVLNDKRRTDDYDTPVSKL